MIFIDIYQGIEFPLRCDQDFKFKALVAHLPAPPSRHHLTWEGLPEGRCAAPASGRLGASHRGRRLHVEVAREVLGQHRGHPKLILTKKSYLLQTRVQSKGTMEINSFAVPKCSPCGAITGNRSVLTTCFSSRFGLFLSLRRPPTHHADWWWW